MRRLLWAVVGACLAAAPSVRAATPESGSFARRGTLTGLVQGIDLLHGRAKLDVSGTPIVLRGIPVQFMRLEPGVLLTVQYEMYGNQYWIPFAGTGGSGRLAGVDPGTFGLTARTETVSGAVQKLDKQNGQLVVRGVTLNAHPEELAGVLPGSFVQLTYRQLLGVNWVTPADRAEGGIRPVPRGN